MGRRTAKINLSSKRIKRFLWDGNVPLHEWEYDLSERPNLSRDKDNLLVYDKEEPVTENLITWVFDENSFVPAAKLVGDKSYSILTDHLGTPYEAYDEDGKKVWARELDLYGNAIAGDSSFIPFLYQGQYYDEEIGLAYNRFRYYSPDSGTYISQDPIGLAGNNPNIYAYVFDSNTEVDVFGLIIEVIRIMSEEEKNSTIKKKGLSVKPNHKGAKWVSMGVKPYDKTNKASNIKVVFAMDDSIIDFFKQDNIDNVLIGDEKEHSNKIITKSNEKGAYGIGVDKVEEFNKKVKSITVFEKEKGKWKKKHH